jgi:single-stranded DNA-binding protein
MDFQKISVFLIGNATACGRWYQPEDGGETVGEFLLAVRNRYGETIVYPIRCSGRTALRVREIQKGDRVSVAGEMEIKSSTDSDGQRQMMFGVVASTCRLIRSSARAVKTTG